MKIETLLESSFGTVVNRAGRVCVILKSRPADFIPIDSRSLKYTIIDVRRNYPAIPAGEVTNFIKLIALCNERKIVV